MKKNNHNAEKSELSGLASVSLLIFWLDRLADVIYAAFANGFFGKIFTSYSAEQAAFERGFLKNHFISSKFKCVFRRVREYLSRLFASSYCLNKVKRFSLSLLEVPLKSYGVSVFFFGLYTVLIYFVRWIVPGLQESELSYALIGISACIVSIPMLISHGSLAENVGRGRLTGKLFRDSFGFREESFEVKAIKKRTKRSNFLLISGMLLGLFTLYVHPIRLIVAVLSVIVVTLIFSSPEIGVLASVFFLPFFSFFEKPTMLLTAFVLVTTASYIIKLISGKRILKFELLDLAVLFFLLLLYFSGVISVGSEIGYREVLTCCTLMFGYFLVVNLLRTERWLKRFVQALIFSGTVVAIIGIFQYCFAKPEVQAWIDSSYFYDIEGRAVSLFENPNILASYLILILPFSLLGWVRAAYFREKLLYLISVSSILICVIFTWSRGAWLSVLISVLIFSCMYTKKTVRVLALIGACIPFLSFLVPQTIKRRFLSIGDLTDSSSMYRLYTWRGSFRSVQEYFMGGVGYGNAAYNEIYPQFAYAGMEAAEHSHSLFLQILFGMGIGGLLIFLVVLLLFSQMNLEYLRNSKNDESRLMVLAGFCALMASLVMGLFDFIWYNYRVFFLFWVILAFSCACVRVGNAEKQRHAAREYYESNQAVMELEL